MSGGSALFFDVVIEAAEATVAGGAFYLGSGASLTLEGGRIEACSAPKGGALAVSGGSAVVRGVRFERCVAAQSGGCAFQDGGRLELAGCTLSRGAAPDGAGVQYDGGAALVVRHSTIEACAASNNGGGISASEAGVQVEASTFRDCTTGVYGAALYLSTPKATATLRRTAVLRCRGHPLGALPRSGPSILAYGTLHLLDGSAIRCAGEAIGLGVRSCGHASVVDASISDCHAADDFPISALNVQAGGAMVQAGGSL